MPALPSLVSITMQLCVILSLALFTCATGAPNFIFVLTDDQDILLNGTSAMPVLQRELVEGGLSLNGFVDVPVCCPSRTSTLSGRYSHNLNNTNEGWCGNFGRVHEGNTWIRTLKSAGYQTALFGKVGMFVVVPPHTVTSRGPHALQYYNDYGAFCENNVHVRIIQAACRLAGTRVSTSIPRCLRIGPT